MVIVYLKKQKSIIYWQTKKCRMIKSSLRRLACIAVIVASMAANNVIDPKMHKVNTSNKL